MSNIDNQQDVLDVRDIIERVEELRVERESLGDAITEANDALDGTLENHDALIASEKALTDWDSDGDGEELATLEALLSDLRGNGGDHEWEGDWYPVTLIHENYFEASMDEMLEDIGVMPKDIPGYLTITVDYDALKQDYTTVDYDGAEYLYR